MRPAARAALAKRLDKLAPGSDRQFSTERLSRDQAAFLDAFNITLKLLPDPVARYAYSLTADGAALVAKLFQINAMASIGRVVNLTDEPETAQNKWRDWLARN
ncbi:hypothetical protein [Mesorhizobium sp. WSM4884]|uniref:hypothetical protein n=1 Tax=Mesorhizobium sp. WSM4884 TaxID=3038542 RepID=UPI002417584A|nr:hypothetical protein [Mesorhizobium sp. WSM4884]MDG4885343.1 hypothetical protein [Mesorhizobium sp. WSM4884]